MIQDFRFAVRQLLQTPGFMTVAVLTLAMAIGVNSASFALINGVMLKPVVPVQPNEVVNVFTARQNASHDYRQFSYVGRVFAKILYQVSPTDPLALVIASLMLATAALLACFFPASRATRVNPMTALRTE